MKRLMIILMAALLLQACSSVKYVPEDEHLLRKTTIKVDNPQVSKSNLSTQLRQTPNHRFMGLIGLELGLYNLSGQDTSKWVNRILRKVGEAPVIYDQSQSYRSLRAMEQSLFNQGYFNAEVSLKEDFMPERKVKTRYDVKAGDLYKVKSYEFNSQGSSLDSLLQASMKQSLIKKGKAFSSEELNNERSRLVSVARNQGYYAINRDHLGYLVDSTVGNHQVDIDLQLKPYTRIVTDEVRYEEHHVYSIDDVYFLLDVPTSAFSRTENKFMLSDYDTLQVDGYYVVYRNKPFLNPRALIHATNIEPQSIYCANDVTRTYAGLNRIECLKYVNIRFVNDKEDPHSLDTYIVLSPNKDNIFSLDVEGTNTAGDLGGALTFSYIQQNIFKGGEVFNANVRGAYEALSASLQNDYWEYGGEVSLTLPKLAMPFVGKSKNRSAATTAFNLSYDNLQRPEFLRTTMSAAMSYSWQNAYARHTFNPLDFAYTYMPRIDSTFEANYMKEGSYLKYSYEDQFIVHTAYNFSYSSVPSGIDQKNRHYYTLRANAEAGGNLLYLAYKQFGTPNEDGQYTIGNIPFSQYLKGEFEVTEHIPFSENPRLAYRLGVGVAYPYGNSKILPFEKRFYSGGANSVRGWSVRKLGPGTFKSDLRGIDFMNQSGDVKLDMSVELRQKWFWLLEGAYFIDAGNIWTLHEYDNQPGGQFRFDRFYKEIACSVGMGVRLNFNVILVRFDMGMKVYDPSGLTNQDRWRLRQIDSDDFAWHFAIGYPF